MNSNKFFQKYTSHTICLAGTLVKLLCSYTRGCYYVCPSLLMPSARDSDRSSCVRLTFTRMDKGTCNNKMAFQKITYRNFLQTILFTSTLKVAFISTCVASQPASGSCGSGTPSEACPCGLGSSTFLAFTPVQVGTVLVSMECGYHTSLTSLPIIWEPLCCQDNLKFGGLTPHQTEGKGMYPKPLQWEVNNPRKGSGGPYQQVNSPQSACFIPTTLIPSLPEAISRP